MNIQRIGMENRYNSPKSNISFKASIAESVIKKMKAEGTNPAAIEQLCGRLMSFPKDVIIKDVYRAESGLAKVELTVNGVRRGFEKYMKMKNSVFDLLSQITNSSVLSDYLKFVKG